MKILAIETSCDDTGIAILEYDKTCRPKILADLVSSQIKVHAPWGGVVPMLAKREHQLNLVPLFKQALKKAGMLTFVCHSERSEESRGSGLPAKALAAAGATRVTDSSPEFTPHPDAGAQNDKIKILYKILDREPELLKKLLPFLKKYQKPDIDYLAVTTGPGLEPALWVGVNFARALSYFWNIPIIPVNHIEGHIAANFIPSDKISGMTNDKLLMTKKLPTICLVVSGGHTQLILVKKLGHYKIVGETRDDAAGEAFDKVAKMLNLGYPGGPTIAATAAKFKIENLKFKIKELPRPMLNSGDFDFSFSGLKTAVLYILQKMTPAQIKRSTSAIAAEFQQAVIDVLSAKALSAAKKYEAKTIILAGGVAANQALRDNLSLAADRLSLNFFVPPINLCVDNAAMIALAAYWQLAQKHATKINWRTLKANANLRIS